MDFSNTSTYTITETGAADNNKIYLEVIKNFLVNNVYYDLIRYDLAEQDFLVIRDRALNYFYFTTYSEDQNNFNGISFYCSNDYDSDFTFYDQPSYERVKLTIPVDGNVNQYHLFMNDYCFHIVTEWQAGYYNHVISGWATELSTEKNLFMIGSNRDESTSFSEVEVNSKALFTIENQSFDMIYTDRIYNEQTSYTNNIYNGSSIPNFDRDFISNSKLKINEKGYLFNPIYFSKVGSTRKPILECSNVFLSYDEFYLPAETFSIGDANFIAFPNFNKTIPSDFNDVKNRGMAVILRIA